MIKSNKYIFIIAFIGCFSNIQPAATANPQTQATVPTQNQLIRFDNIKWCIDQNIKNIGYPFLNQFRNKHTDFLKQYKSYASLKDQKKSLIFNTELENFLNHLQELDRAIESNSQLLHNAENLIKRINMLEKPKTDPFDQDYMDELVNRHNKDSLEFDNNIRNNARHMRRIETEIEQNIRRLSSQ